METLLIQELNSTIWTKEENKRFESALALFDKDSPDRWHKVAQLIPGKSEADVYRQYQVLEEDVSDIEAGLIPSPGYFPPSFKLELANNHSFNSFGKFYEGAGKSSSSSRPSEHERRKGVPWTEHEHRLFLLGLQKYGKGDWRNISRNFVKSKTATQVASHAQKYFIRQQLSEGGKDKRRPSIHDITTVDLAEITAASPKSPPSDQPTILPKSNFTPKIVQEWSHYNERAFMFMASPFEIASHGNHFHVL